METRQIFIFPLIFLSMNCLLFYWFSATFKIFFFSAKLATLSSKSKGSLAQNQDKVLKEIFFRSSINLSNPSVLLFVCFAVFFSANRSNDRTINSDFKMHFICGEPIFIGFIGQSSKYRLFHTQKNWDLSI